MTQIIGYYLRAILIFVGVSAFALLTGCDSPSDFSDEDYVARARKTYSQGDLLSLMEIFLEAMGQGLENAHGNFEFWGH